jgi:hypothetical protein
MTAGLGRVLVALALAVGAIAVPVGPLAAPTARAAAPDLTIVSSARYDVQPERQRVRVTVDLTLTNHLHDTVTKRYYFDHAFLAVLPESSDYAFHWDGAGVPAVRVANRTKSYTLLRLDLAQRLTSGKSAGYRLTFDLADPGGAPTRDLRVGNTLVSFPVWAFASDETPGSSVTVVFPKGYQIQVEAGSIPAPTTADDGRSTSSRSSSPTARVPMRRPRSRPPSSTARSRSWSDRGRTTRRGANGSVGWCDAGCPCSASASVCRGPSSRRR